MRAHDIRRLKFSAYCQQLGLPENLLETEAGLLHGRCAVETLTEPELLALPPRQQGKFTVRDVGVDLMKRLVAGWDCVAGNSPARRAGQGVLQP